MSKSKNVVWYTVEILPRQSDQFSKEKPSYGELIAIKNFHDNQSRKEAVEFAKSLFKVVNPFAANPTYTWDARVFICTWSVGKRASIFARYEEVKK